MESDFSTLKNSPKINEIIVIEHKEKKGRKLSGGKNRHKITDRE